MTFTWTEKPSRRGTRLHAIRPSKSKTFMCGSRYDGYGALMVDTEDLENAVDAYPVDVCSECRVLVRVREGAGS